MMSGMLDFSNAQVLIVGDVMLDHYWHGDASRVSPEAPVHIVNIDHIEYRGGGAANVALNVDRLGGNAYLSGIVGDDIDATHLDNCLKNKKITCQLTKALGKKTISKLRVMSRQQHMIRLDFESDYADVADELLTASRSLFDKANSVILSDYAKGTLKNAEQMIAHANHLDLPVIVDPKSKDFTIYEGATLITPNLAEFEAVVGYCANDAILISKAKTLCHDLGLHALLITRSERGMILTGPDIATLNLPARAVDVVDVTGAGDTVVATLACALASGCMLSDAVHLANLAASLVVQQLGAASVTGSELQSALLSGYQFN